MPKNRRQRRERTHDWPQIKQYTLSSFLGRWQPNAPKKPAPASGDDKNQDNTVKIWNINTGITTLTYTGHTGTAVYVAWSPDGARIASASQNKTVQVW
ncbi:MAG: hypothetical protein PVS3B1_07560 [Ktedonobacteraceae bacterium]